MKTSLESGVWSLEWRNQDMRLSAESSYLVKWVQRVL
jgi:hypothetical protein